MTFVNSRCSMSLAIDPVVVTSLYAEGKLLKRRRTSAAKATHNPVWNEAHVFELPTNLLDSVLVEFSVSEHEFVGSGAVIGVCRIGQGCKGLEGFHWKEIRHNARKTVAKWHVLRNE